MGRIKNKDLYLLKYLPQATDYVVGSDEENNGETVNFELGALTALVQNYGQSDRIISGKAIWIPGTLSFYIQEIEYYLRGEFHTTDPITITLAVADPTNPRKDVIAVTIDEEVYVETGTPSPDPAKPTLPNGTDYLELTFVDIAAGATIPTGAEYETIYANFLGEPTEWTTTENTGGSRIILNDDVFVNSSPVSISMLSPNDGDTITFTNDSPFVLDPNDNFQFYIRSPYYLSTIRTFGSLKIRFYKSGSPVSNYITLRYPGTNSISTFYPVSVTLDKFTFSDTSYDRVDIEMYGIDFDFRIDDVGIVRNINDPLDGDFVPTGGYEGTGQDLYTLIYNHINDTTIHFTQSQISITESQISDLQDYALASDLVIPNNEIVFGTGTGITSTPNFKWDGLGFLSIYNNVVDSNPNFHIGADSTNKLEIVAAYNTGTNTLDRAEIRTSTTSGVPNDGKINFYVDDIHIVDVNDGGIRFEPTMAIWWTSLGGTSVEVISFDINRSLLINNNDEGDGGDIIFSTLAGTSPSVIIKQSGNVSIGNTNDIYKFDLTGNSKFRGTVEIDTINAATVDTDKFLVSDGSLIKFRTGAELLSDIGASGSSHNHTLDSLSNVSITTNSAGEILKWDGASWINNTLSEAGIASTTDLSNYVTLTTTQTISGLKTFNDASLRIRNTADTFNFVIRGGNITADRLAALPILLSDDTFVFEDHIQTLTNKTISLVSNTLTGTKTLFNTALTDGDFMFIGDAPTAHTLDSHSNVTITANSAGEILKWNGSAWINNTLAEAGIAASSAIQDWLRADVADSKTSGDLSFNNGVNINMLGSSGVRFGNSTEALLAFSTNFLARLTSGDFLIQDSTNTRFTFGRTTGNLINTGVITSQGTGNSSFVGNVGIGTITPLTKLHVQNASTTIAWSPTLGTAAIFESNTSSRSFINIVGNSAGQSELWFGNQTIETRGRVRYEHTPDTMSFWTAAGQKAQISSAGNFSIGNTNNTYKLDVSGTVRAEELLLDLTDIGTINVSTQSNGYIVFGNISGSTNAPTMSGKSNDNTGIQLLGSTNNTNTTGDIIFNVRENDNTDFATLTSKAFVWSRFATELANLTRNGNLTTIGTMTATNFILSSDERLKTNIFDVFPRSIHAEWKTFQLKEDLGQNRYGVIAQELEQYHPEFVRTNDEGIKSVAYIDLLIAKIAELEQRIRNLEN